MTARFSKIKFGAGLSVEDEGGGVITVSGGGGGGTGPPGETGPEGPEGPQGDPGVGVPTGGSDGQVLTKQSGTDYDTGWETSGGGSPTGAAGGVLSGTYPNPGFAADMATQAELDAHVTDTTDAHDASAISVADVGGYFTASDVEAALQELGVAAGGPPPVAGIVLSWGGYVPLVPSYGNVWVIPYLEGASVSFDLTRIYARVETPGSGSTDLTLDKSPSGGAYTATFLASVTIASGGYQVTSSGSFGTVSSGDLIRVVFPGPIGVFPDLTPYTVELEGEET